VARQITGEGPIAPLQLRRAADSPVLTTFKLRVVAIVAGKLAARLAVVLLGLMGGLVAAASQPYWPMFVGLLLVGAALLLAVFLSRPFAIALSVVAVALTGLVGASQMAVSTPPIRDSNGNAVAGSIAEMRTLNLGGGRPVGDAARSQRQQSRPPVPLRRSRWHGVLMEP